MEINAIIRNRVSKFLADSSTLMRPRAARVTDGTSLPLKVEPWRFCSDLEINSLDQKWVDQNEYV